MNYYQETAEGYTELHREEQLEKLHIIRENISLPGKMLDIGCGPLWSAEFFDDVVGIDPAFEGKDIIRASAEKLPFPDKTFDTILCVTAIHHFKLDAAILEMKRVAKKNAQLVITVLKKSPKFNNIVKILNVEFVLEKKVDQQQDEVYFLRSK
ncbi:MAG TPA: class I SAM-dependent methyltransferase [Candidatus Nanoarchaeia archaeon]|nr:class I SAM-dependent methyltransferase [Candidatus Nanoarchaeia archaeon]